MPTSPPVTPASVPVNTFTADYPNLFGDYGIERCTDDALESSFGPFAYAESLMTIVRRLERKVGTPPVSPLLQRRPDITELVLDEPALNRRVPKLSLAIECLEAMVESTDGTGANAAAILAASTSPAHMPFDRAWTLITQVLRSKRQLPWQLLRQTDEDYPNFSHRTIVNTSSRSALALCTGLAPAQLRVLQLVPASTGSAVWSRLGLPVTSTIEGLADSAALIKALGLNRKRLRQLLAVNGVAKDGDTNAYTSVTVSACGKPGGQPGSHAFGASFINDGVSPSLRLIVGTETGNAVRIENLSIGRLQRIDAMLRLHVNTGLSFAALDRLLQAIFSAQGRKKDVAIDGHVLRAVGLYIHLRDSRRVNLDAFAAVIHEISPFATGRDTPYYDRLFHLGAGGSELAGSGSPLTMDDGTFVNVGGDATMQRLCAGLGIGAGTLSTLLAWAMDAQTIATPVRNLSLVSACHRLAVLPRWMGLDEKQGLALLRLLKQTQPDLFNQLAGHPSLSNVGPAKAGGGDAATPDIVDAIVTLMNFSEWLRTHRLDAVSVHKALDTDAGPQADMARLVPHGTAQREALAVTDERLHDAFLDMPFAANAERKPTIILSSLLEENGLFKDTVFALGDEGLDAAIAVALEAVRDTTAGDPRATSRALELTKKRVVDRLRESMAAQSALADQILAALLPAIADPELRANLAEWAGATPSAVLGLLGGASSSEATPWLSALHRRARLVSLLAVDNDTLTAMRTHRAWFDLDQADLEDPGLIVVHRLADWNRTTRTIATRTSIDGQTASANLLAYLASAGDTGQNDPAARLGDLLGLEKTVVACVAAALPGATDGASLTTASHVAWLLRLQGLADRSGTSVEALLALAHLDPASDSGAMEAAGQLLLATCQPADRDAIVGMHNEAWRDALVAWLQTHSSNVDGRRLTGHEELSAWLLTDVDVGPEPETTRLAAALDSLQLYIHRLLSGLEKHVNPGANIKEERRQWSAYRSRYVDWRQFRERRTYPENHIDPARRQRKTSAFIDLEAQLAQGQARPADIDTTLLKYLADFERNSNIQVLAAYHDGDDPTTDQLHLVGRSNIAPYEYFWQSGSMGTKAADGHTGMLAWSGWTKVELPVNGELTHTRIPKPSTSSQALAEKLLGETTDADKAAVALALDIARYDEDDTRDTIETIRPLIIDGRKYIVWIERDTSAVVFDSETAASEYYALRVCYSYLDTNGNWSASNTLLDLDGRAADGTRSKPPAGEAPKRLLKRSYKPGLIVMENRKGKRESDPYLVAMVFDSENTRSTATTGTATWTPDKDYFLAVRDLLLIDSKRLDDAPGNELENRLVDNWFRLFRDPRVVQHPYIGAKYALTPPGESEAATEVEEERLASLGEKIFMAGADSVQLTAKLTSAGNEIEVTGTMDDQWVAKSTSKREINSVDDIDRVCFDCLITMEAWTIQTRPDKPLGSVQYHLRANVDADSFNEGTITLSHLSVRSNTLAGEKFSLGFEEDLRTTKGALALLGRAITELDIEAKSIVLPGGGSLSRLLTKPSFSLHDVPVLGSIYSFVSANITCLDIPVTLEPKPLDTAESTSSAIPLTATLIRVGNTGAAGTATADPGLLADLTSKDADLQRNLGADGTLATLHALATSGAAADRAALAAWLPLLTDPWQIPAKDYYEALRNEGLEYGISPEGALSGSLPFLQAMHATSRDSLRSAFVEVVAGSLGSSLAKATRDKVPSALRTKLVWFAVREQAGYRALLARMATSVNGHSADVVIKSEVLDAHAPGEKRITARIPVDVDDTDYTFRLELSTTDDPTIGAAGDVRKWIRLTALYRLANVTDGDSALPDDRVPTARIRRNRAQAQYLDLDESGVPPIRLNTLFGKQLVARATRSVDAAISIEAQTLPEPALRAGGSGGFVDFRGANGLYFWELFFYVPWLVAWGLREKGHYAEAWQWCSHYLFDPFRGRTTATTAPVPFWNCLPLVYPLDGARDSGDAPELAGYANSIYFRKAIHAFLVDMWRLEGDEHFRHMNPDSLREANLCYQKALQLIGTLQDPAEARPWTPTRLGSRKAVFVQPVNRALRDRRTLLLGRLENLRHGRTIDGVLIPYLGYGDEEAESGGSGGRRGSTGGLRALFLSTMPAYRFHEVIAMALTAVERLTELGRYLFRIYEHEADNALDVERQKNLLALADFDISLRRKAVETTRRERNTLHLGKQAVESRVRYFTDQLASTRSGLEIAASTLSVASSFILHARYTPIAVGAVLSIFPNIWGMAFGGQKLKGPSKAADKALEVAAEATRLLAEDLRVEAAYERRNQEWAHDKIQAEHDLRIIGSQLEEQTSRAEFATIELDQAIKRREYLRGEFEVQTTGFAIASTYTWMLGRLGELFASAYQSVFTLCLDAESSYRYETGDFDSRHVRLDAWDGARRGLFAGEALQNDLQALQSAYLRRHVRRLDVRRSISLRALLGDDEFKRQRNAGSLRFALDTKLFDADFPGHYLRQIRHLALTLIPTADARTLRSETEIRAVLTQSSSTLLYRPDPEGVEWLYDPEKGRTDSIVRDLRGGQQTVFSRAAPKPTADAMETIMLRTEYADGRYGTFEGTGAISEWTLAFPGEKTDFRAYRDDVDDIEIRLDYLAAWGGAELEEKVDSLLEASPAVRRGRVVPTASSETEAGSETTLPTDIPVGTPVYPTPVVRETSANNAIDRRDTPNGATITVAPWAYIRKGQAIWLRCLGTKADGTSHDVDIRVPPSTITEEEVTKGLVAVIPLSYLEALGDRARLRVVLRVGLSGSSKETRATAFPEVSLDLPRCSSLRVLMNEATSISSLPDPAVRCDYGYVATSAEVGPMSLTLNGTTKILHVRGVDASGKEHIIHCVASRRLWRANRTSVSVPWDSAMEADGRDHQNSTQLVVAVRAKDNPDLPFGTYRGHATLQLMGWQVPRVMESIVLDLDVVYRLGETVEPEALPGTVADPEVPEPVIIVREFAAPTLEVKDGIVVITIPGSPAFLPGDYADIDFREPVHDQRVLGNLYSLYPGRDGLQYSVYDKSWELLSHTRPGQTLSLSYDVFTAAGVPTRSSTINVKLTPSEKDPKIMIPVVVKP